MKIRAAAVPEHFFYPWKIWLERKEQPDIIWEWLEYPGGSGDMLRALEEGETDIAFLLTESALQAKSRGAEIEILSVFVQSPLLWGIFSGAQNPISSVEEGKTYAISRFGSGSHLMAILEASGRGKEISEEGWQVVANLEGARKSLTSGSADLFFWEKWTTSPLVDSGDFKMLSVFPGPWPAFLLCAGKKITQNEMFLKAVKDAASSVASIAAGLKKDPAVAFEISRFYGIKENFAAEWLMQVEWAKTGVHNLSFVRNAWEILKNAGLISQGTPYQELSGRKEL